MTTNKNEFNETNMLPFGDISDLLDKVEVIKAAHKMCVKAQKKYLQERDIPYQDFADYRILIDLKHLTKEQMDDVLNIGSPIIKSAYEKLNISLWQKER